MSDRSVLPCPAGFFRGLKERPVRVFAVAGGQVVVDALQGRRVGRHVPDLAAFAENAQVGHALAALQVAHAQAAQFLATQPVVEKRRQDGPVPLALERV